MKGKSQSFEKRQVMKNDKFEVFHYKEPKATKVEVHDHDFYEIYFLLNGDVSYWVEGKTYNLELGDVLLINPAVLHRPIYSEKSKVYDRIVLWINKKYLDEKFWCLSECFRKASESKNYLIKFNNKFELSEITTKFAKLVNEYYDTNFANDIYAETLFLQIMIELNRIFDFEKNKIDNVVKKSNLISHIIEFIDENYKENITLEFLAEKYYLSKYHISHEFSKEVGISLHSYIVLKRLTVAKQMILEGKNANEICFDCGFNDYANFYRAFKNEYGISPRQLKNNYLESL